jgi:N-acetylglucosamine-6-phosphate deacetylase
MIIQNGNVLTPAGVIEGGWLRLANGLIDTVSKAPLPETEEPVLDAAGLLVAPGFIDLQLNGGWGHDFTADPTTIWPVAAQLPAGGVTSFLPTIITAPPPQIVAAQAVLAAGPPAGWQGATPLGLHLEGPFLNPAKKGAHDPAYLRPPSLEAVADWSPAAAVRLVTLAPELPQATAVIETLSAQGVVVSAGHSLATYRQAQAALAAGISYGTHLFNAMPSLHQRQPGLAAALLADTAVTVGIIADGLHVHPALVKLAWQLLGPTRFNLVTDGMAALGCPPGQYRLGPTHVTVDTNSARLADGTLAGSLMPLDQTLRNLMAYSGCTLVEAVATVTAVPARLLQIDHQKGVIAPGHDADLVLLTPDGQVVITIIQGEIVWRTMDHRP